LDTPFRYLAIFLKPSSTDKKDHLLRACKSWFRPSGLSPPVDPGVRRNEEKRTDKWLASLLKKMLEVDNKTKRREKEE